MEKTYEERLEEHLGPATEGEHRIFGLGETELIATIKENLKNSFSCTLWTFEHPAEQIREEDELLTREGIVHCYDEVIDAFLCFNSVKDMNKFYLRIQEDMKKKGIEI